MITAGVKEIKNNPSLEEDCKRIRMQLILAFSNLYGIISVETTDDMLKKELSRWVKYMNKLHRESIELLKPGPRLVAKGNRKGLSQILKYQGIDEGQMREALDILQ